MLIRLSADGHQSALGIQHRDPTRQRLRRATRIPHTDFQRRLGENLAAWAIVERPFAGPCHIGHREQRRDQRESAAKRHATPLPKFFVAQRPRPGYCWQSPVSSRGIHMTRLLALATVIALATSAAAADRPNVL